jgi:hypothetical protein
MDSVFIAAGFTFGFTRFTQFDGQSDSALADPANMAARNAHHNRIGGHGLRDHCTRTNQSVFADLDAAQNGAVRAEGRTPLDESFFKLFFAGNMSARIDHIGKNHAGSTENIIFELDQVVDAHIVLYAAAVTDFGSWSHIGVLSKRAVFADLRVCSADMREVPDFGALANLGARVNDG